MDSFTIILWTFRMVFMKGMIRDVVSSLFSSKYTSSIITLQQQFFPQRLAEVAHSLLKVAPYDPATMGCRGLQRYMNEILPHPDWSHEDLRPALVNILRRLDKMFNKIAKKNSIRVGILGGKMYWWFLYERERHMAFFVYSLYFFFLSKLLSFKLVFIE